MNSTEKLLHSMAAGRVYRRKELEEFSKAVDRDLKSLVESKSVRKLSGGVYYRPRMNAFGAVPPDDHELVRAFLNSSTFLLTSFNYFTQLGLGLTQVYNSYWVYNHKRWGEKVLGGKRFVFRHVAEFPVKLDKEFLLVDLFNNLERLPDDSAVVMQNLKSHLSEFDQVKVHSYLHLYGSSRAKQAFEVASA